MPKITVDLDDIPDPFMLVEPGEYRATIMEVERTESNQGNRMLVFHMKPSEDGPAKGAQLRYFAVLEPKNALGNLKQIMVAMGYSGKVSPDISEFVGKEVMLSITNEPYTNDQGVERMTNTINRVYSVSEARAASGSGSRSRSRRARGGGAQEAAATTTADDDDLVIGGDDDGDENELPF